jgi:CDP-glucose 4,6-dehydratase
MEDLVINPKFWKNKKVLITGHTGFKGGWLSLYLQHLGANIIGVSLDPPTNPSFYQKAEVSFGITSLRQDIRNGEKIKKIFHKHQPEIVFHLAAQSLVRYSYKHPIETFETNIMGTAHVLEAIRSIDTVLASILVTTDKCYKNQEWYWGYREIDPMGGHDPYSSSKGASELLINSYKDSFLPRIASVRAGNVVGGGDWAEDRLIPDIVRAFHENKKLEIRNPHSIRPWQHVLEPLTGYIQLAEKLAINPTKYAQAWNFGPNDEDARSVKWIVEQMAKQWGADANWLVDESNQPHEANYLKLDCSKAHIELNWHPKWRLQTTLQKVVSWHKKEANRNNMRKTSIEQIEEYIGCNSVKL